MFGFLKNKLKEWVGGAKEKLKPEETIEKPIEKEKKSEKNKKEKETRKKETPSKKEKKKKVEIKQEEANIQSSVSTETDIIHPEPIPQELDLVKEVSKEQEKMREVTEELEKQQITPKQAVEEIQEIHEKTEEEIQEKKSFLGKLFGKKKEIAVKEALKESSTPKVELIQQSKPIQEAKPELPFQEVETPVKKSFFEKVKSTFTYKITPEDFDSLFEDLDMLLLENNVAMEVVEDIKSKLSKKLIGKEIKKDELEKEIKKELKSTLNEILIDPDDPLDAIKLKKDKPFVMLFFGINGTGKTTSIAKLAYQLKQKGFSVVLAAADTFRAASIEQISEHAKKLDVPLIKHEYGADPAAVGFDAIKYAKNHRIDVVLIDTAGRMHTKTNLMSEMEKIVRVTNPDLKIFVAESIAGNDATEQAKSFHESVNIDGSILSKADVDEKGGTIISVSAITHKPIFYLGTGQTYNDIKLFNKQEYIESLGL